MKKALAWRCDYRATQAAVSGAEAAVRAVRAGYRPTLSAQASYGERRMPDASDQPEGIDDHADGTEPRITGKEDLENLVLDTRNGRTIHVRDVAEARRAVGPVEIAREDQVKQVIVRADPAAGVSVGDATARAAAAATALTRPPGVSFALGGQAQIMAENRRTLGMILGFAAFFAFAVLAIQFESFRLPIIFSSVCRYAWPAWCMD